MNEVVVLTPERILEVTEDVLRRFGLAKATVVDVARALDVSHGSVYRHFPSKASLRQAVAKRWLDRVSAPLARRSPTGSGPAPARLERWLRALCSAKQKKVSEDPEMFATYLTLAREACVAVKAHKEKPGRSDRGHHFRWHQAGRLRGHRRQGVGARDSRGHQPLPSSRACRGMERCRSCGAVRCAAGAAAEGPGGSAQALRRVYRSMR